MPFLNVPELNAKLVHHTGTMVRFTTSQLVNLPDADQAVVVVTPDGTELESKFHYHPANPYVGGRELVDWIKRAMEVPFGVPQPITVIRDGEKVRIKFPTAIDSEQNRSASRTVRGISKKLKNKQPKKIRRILTAWERDPELRDLALAVWDHQCQVEGCKIGNTVPHVMRKCLLDVHHLNHISAGGRHNDALNVCLLCAGHHMLVHRAKPSQLLECSPTRAIIQVGTLKLKISRDITPLQRMLT